ncbi:MAG: serine/threonine-protein kinase, partial [Acidobacteriota bacterium]|nr:serine/threonine-protein kinase [Acidobacteriota bacterium]
MSLHSGLNLLHYRLVEKIGEGGMGVVWKAVDTTLDREVAIKVLPEAFSADTGRLARFEREAKLLASLNHSNIGAIYGLHHAETPAGTIRFLAMELVEGETLAARLSRGSLPVEHALELALQVVEALEAAHDNDVVHRDLKPANIQVTPDGKVKVLDFGLAKALETESESVADSTHSPTLTFDATRAGVILGTAAYMSPEQARGHRADRRSDLWSFGVVLWEMLTGKRLFEGET